MTFFECPHCSKPIIISKPEKEPATKAQPGNLEEALAPWAKFLIITKDKKLIVVQAKTWLGEDVWRSVNKWITAYGGQWVPAGKESHWEVPVK